MRNLLASALAVGLAVACADRLGPGRDAFHGGHVLVEESREAGRIVLEPGSEFDPFQGNGRTCGSCHKAQDNFGMSQATRQNLRRNDPFFFPGLDEDLQLLREHGLVHVRAGRLDEFRQTPKLNGLCRQCNDDGNCLTLGLNGDRVPNLHAFTVEAIINHSAKSPRRVAGRDFVLPDADVIDDIVQYMLSDEVCSQSR